MTLLRGSAPGACAARAGLRPKKPAGLSSRAPGLDEHIGTVTAAKLADPAIVNSDPLAGPHVLADPAGSGWSWPGR